MPIPKLKPNQWLLDIVTNIRFFTRIPVPKLNSADEESNPPDFTRVPRFFPIVGAIVALPALLVIPLQYVETIPNLLVAVFVVLSICALSGGIHEDGLADCADGFFGGESPQRRLEIMKDSAIGSFGVLALIFSILTRVVLVEEALYRMNALTFVLTMVAMAAVSRSTALWTWPLLPAARTGGLAAKFGIPSVSIVLQANLLALLLSIPLLIVLPSSLFLFALTGCILAVFLVAMLAKSKIGGQTGDVIGASQQVAEIGFLVGLLVIDSALMLGTH